MKNYWEVYNVIDDLLENYKSNDYLSESHSINDRINGFVNEFEIEMEEYVGDKQRRIYRYMIKSIIELVEEVV